MTPPTASKAKPEGFHIPSLDGLRALSFLGVFASHTAPDKIRVPGPFGVTVFFFLSGFLITTLLRVEAETTGGVSLKAFYLRRTLRIWPPFYIVLGISTAVALVLGDPSGGGATAAKVLHLANYWIVGHGWDETPPGTTGYWSLAVEEHFYLVFPTIYLLLRRWSPRPAVQAAWVLLLCGLVLAWRCVLVYGLHVGILRTYVATDARFDSILFGCVLALWGNPVLDTESRISAATWKWVLFPAGCALALFSFTFHDIQLRETVRYSLQGVALVPIFVTAIRFHDWGPFRVLNLRFVRFIGVLSYSLYLLHEVVLLALSRHAHLSPLSAALVGLPLSFASSYAMYRLVEVPCARIRKRLSKAHLPRQS